MPLHLQLLMGEIPDRAMFNTPDLATALRPYLALTGAVRRGNLRGFGDAVLAHSATLARDRTLTLVRRLDANVIKTGLRKLATSYSRINFSDIAAKLQLGSPEDAEFLCAKVCVLIAALLSYCSVHRRFSLFPGHP